MKFLEKDLEEIIYETPNEKLVEKGLNIRGNKIRQLRIGHYGISDIVTYTIFNGDLFITVFELKKESAGISAFLQAVRYVKGIKEYLEHREFSGNVSFHIVLVAKKIDTKSDYIFLEQFMNESYSLSLSNYSYEYNFDGVTFKLEEDYKLINNGF